jgi:peptide/nickel transport system permease protein
MPVTVLSRNKNVAWTLMGLSAIFILAFVGESVFSVRLVLMWTDSLIFLLFALILLFMAYASQHEHLSTPWRQVRRRRLGMISVIILLAYVVIGLSDSIHFNYAVKGSAADSDTSAMKYSGEIVSVFDVILDPVTQRIEKTYSAPFATRAFVKENIELADGSVTRGYPKLKYGGAHLKDDKDRVADIASKAVLGALYGLLMTAILTAVLIFMLAMGQKKKFSQILKNILNKETETPWHYVILTVAVLCILMMASVQLSTSYHIFGTDKVGQDVFYQTLKSIRTGLVIGTLTTLIMLPFAVLFGIMAGFFRGWVDDVIQYTYTTLNSIPGILLIAASILLLQVYMAQNEHLFNSILERNDLRLLFLCMILGITSWTGLCRMLRGETLKLREMDYIQSATALGVNRMVIIVRHILPNVMHIVLIAIVLDFSGLVLAEAVLSYVGIGVDPGMNSWGNMINQARLEMARDPMVWWSLIAAFVFMFILVLAANMFSDAVRDAYDPRLREKR